MNRYLVMTSLVLLAGCAFKTRADLAAEQSESEGQRQTVSQQRTIAQQSPRQTAAKPTRVAGQTGGEDFDQQMREQNGRIDTLENSVSQLKAEKQGDQDSVTKQKAAIDQKFVDYEAALKKMEEEIAKLNEDVAKLKANVPPPAPVVEKKEEPTAPAAATKAKAMNEIGDEQFGAKKWKEAIVSYQKFRDANPKSRKFADVTYKIGVCFQELGMKDEAKAFYEEVSAKFPGSKEAKKAAQRSKSLR